MTKKRMDAKQYLQIYLLEVKRRDALLEAADKVNDFLRDLLKVIDALPDEKYKTVITLRYINGLSHSAIAQKMRYSYDHITRLHCEALDAMNTILESQ